MKALLLFVAIGCASPAFAQSTRPLTLASSAFLVAATADNAFTTAGLYTGRLTENDPLAKWAAGKPAGMFTLGLGEEAAELAIWHRLARQHPKWATVGLIASGSIRSYFAVVAARNLERGGH